MIILEELFKNLTEFRQYAPYSCLLYTSDAADEL